MRKISTASLKDFAITVVVVFGLFPIFYLTTSDRPNIYSLIFFIAILVPTVLALINGAPFVPTPIDAVKKMVELAKIKKGEKVYDIGCGDGRIVYLANKDFEADATGFELSPLVFLLACIRKIIWKSKAKIRFGNFKNKNLSDADVIFCYLLPDTLKKLQEKLDRELKPGARVVSYAFQIGNWTESHKEPSIPAKNIASIYVYHKK